MNRPTSHRPSVPETRRDGTARCSGHLDSRLHFWRFGLPAILVTALVAGTAFRKTSSALWAAPAGYEPTVWACGESLKVAPDQPPQNRNGTWDAATRAVQLSAARQEYVAFQVVVRAGQAPLRNVRVRMSALTSPGGKQLGTENIDLFQQRYLKVTVPSQHDNGYPVKEVHAGEFPVQMIPLRGESRAAIEVPSGRSQPVWVDVYVPEDQAPGEYTGTIEVHAGEQSLSRLPVRLTVWDFTLPRETHLKTHLPTGPEQIRWGFGIGPREDARLARLEDKFFQMAHQHRLEFHPSASGASEEEWGGRYRAYLDGSAFRERLGKGAGQRLVVFGAEEEEDAAGVTRVIRRTVDWWKRLKRPMSDLVFYTLDEPSEPEEYAEATMRAAWAKAAAPDLPTFLTIGKPENVPGHLIDIWGEIPASDVPNRLGAGQKVWAVNHGYAGGPFVDTPGYAGRSQAWMAWKLGLDAWYFWDCCYWTDRQNLKDPQGKPFPRRVIDASPAVFLTDTWNDPMTFDQKRNPRRKDWIRLNGDGVLFYPGAPAGLEEPLASFTMKSLRRGLQDYEYLWLAHQKRLPVDDLVGRVVPQPEQWASDPETWDAARLELGRRLAASR